MSESFWIANWKTNSLHRMIHCLTSIIVFLKGEYAVRTCFVE